MLKASEEFVKGKHGIGYITDSFKEKFNDKEFELKSVPTFQKLPRSMNDAAIESELKPGICDLGDVLAFLDNSKEGTKEGTKDGYSNIFYTSDFVVIVRWFEGEWFVLGWLRDGGHWSSSMRVFSPATGSLNSCTHCSLETRILELENFKKNVEKVLKLG